MEKQEAEKYIQADAKEYMRLFDPFSEENPPYVPADGAALYFSRVYYWVDDAKRSGFCYYPKHITPKELKKEENMHHACEASPCGRRLNFKIHNCIYPGKEPARNVQEEEYILATMGALGEEAKEVLKGAFFYEEILLEMEPGKRETIEKAREWMRVCQGMDAEEFWKVIDEVNRKTDQRDQEAVLKATGQKLMELPARDIVLWHQIKREYMNLADKKELWKVCAEMNGHTSDDEFMDFRSWLISQGKETYMQVLEEPDSLKRMNLSGVNTSFESYLYIAVDVYAQKKAVETEGLAVILKDYWNWMMEEGCPGEEPYIRNLEKVYDLYEQTVFYPLPEKVKEQIHSQVNPEPDIRSGWDQNMMNLPC